MLNYKLKVHLKKLVVLFFTINCLSGYCQESMDRQKSIDYAKAATDRLVLKGPIKKESLDLEFKKAYEDFFEFINKSLEYDSTNTYALYWKGKVELQEELYEKSLETFEKYLKTETYGYGSYYFDVNNIVFLLKKKLKKNNCEVNLEILFRIISDRLRINPNNSDALTLKLMLLLYKNNKAEAINFVNSEFRKLGDKDYFLKVIENFELQYFLNNIKSQI